MSKSNHAQHDAMEPEPRLEAAVLSVLAQPLDPDAIARVKARAVSLQVNSWSESGEGAFSVPSGLEVEQTHKTKRSTPFLSRSFMMKLFSTAAAIVVVAVGGIFLMQPSRSAFADVMDQLRDARSFTYVTHIFTEGKTKPIVTKTWVSEDGRQRQENSAGTITLMDKDSQIRITLITATKTAIVVEHDDTEKKASSRHPVDWMEDLKSRGDKPDEKLGKKELDGHSVEGFVVKHGPSAYTVWVDTGSRKLFQIEWEMPVKGSSITKIVRTDFRFNEKLDDSLFSFDVPEGYTEQKQMKLVPANALGGEKSIVEALRGFARRSGGKFPKSISEWGEWAILLSRVTKDGQLDDDARLTMSHLGSILPFLTSLKKNDYEYIGSGKTVDDKKCIVFWYRSKDGGLRAIYNDMSTADVQEQDLP